MKSSRRLRISLACLALAAALAPASEIFAQAAPAAEPAKLPRKHAWEQTLITYMGTLTAKDFEHGVTAPMEVKPASTDPDYQYRNYIYTLTVHPLVGTKRGSPAVNSPAENYTLAKIETDKGVYAPAGWSEATMSFVQFDYPGNPFHDNRALKMRAFVCAAVNMMMIDAQVDKDPAYGRTDRLSYYLVRCAAAYPDYKKQLPAEVQKAFEAGLRQLGERILSRPPQGDEANLDMMAPVGLSYVAFALNDGEFSKRVEEYSKQYFTDPKRFNPAGYWVERGGLDISFSGTTNYFAIWTALMNNWPFVNEAVDKVYRLRAHLMLPEPGGKFAGPTQFNTRTGGAALVDQWDYGNRDRGAVMITDEAAYLTPVPTKEQLEGGGATRAQTFAAHMGENGPRGNGKTGFQSNDEIVNGPWGYSILANFNFPASVNPAYEFYKKGSLAHLEALAKKNSPMLKSPYERGETFVRDFNKAFYATRQPGYAAIIHSGPVGEQRPDDGLFQFGSPLGFGGGQLCAFWTPSTGSVLLSRRAGQHWQVPFDKLAEWRTWPLHAVSGVTASGTPVSSARITRPEVAAETTDRAGKVTVSGALVALKTVPEPDAPDKSKARDLYYDGPTEGKIAYSRAFNIEAKGVSVETTLTGDGKDSFAELYETLPVLLTDPQSQGTEAPNTRIEFQSGQNWTAATENYADAVTAVRITRFAGAVTITFDKPRRVKLSPAVWTDTFITKATCRTVLVDLLESGDKPAGVSGAKKISYKIAPADK